MNSRGSSGLGDRSGSSQHSTSVEAAALRAALGLPGTGEVPAARRQPARGARRRARSAATASQAAMNARRCPRRRTAPRSRPPGRSHDATRVEERLVVGDPVEGRGREDDVHRLGEPRARAGRSGSRSTSGPQPRPRLLDHRRRAVDADQPAAASGRRSSRSSVTRPQPQPASSTVSSPRRSRAVEHRGPPLQLRVADPVVGVRVPVARAAPPSHRAAYSAVVTGPRRSVPARARRRRSSSSRWQRDRDRRRAR